VCGRPWKAAGAVGSAPCLVLVPFLKMEPKPKGVQDGSEECRERQGLPRKRRLGSEEAKRLAEDKVWVQKAPEVQWKCRQTSGSGRKTAGGNRSEALGLGCRDKSGIGAVAATFLFRGCQRKKEGLGKKLSGAVARLPGVAGGKAGSSSERPEVSGAAQNEPRESRWCHGSERSAGR